MSIVRSVLRTIVLDMVIDNGVDESEYRLYYRVSRPNSNAAGGHEKQKTCPWQELNLRPHGSVDSTT
jgi:hypothetical protein